jgi:hypothetical protein
MTLLGHHENIKSGSLLAISEDHPQDVKKLKKNWHPLLVPSVCYYAIDIPEMSPICAPLIMIAAKLQLNSKEIFQLSNLMQSNKKQTLQHKTEIIVQSLFIRKNAINNHENQRRELECFFWLMSIAKPIFLGAGRTQVLECN